MRRLTTTFLVISAVIHLSLYLLVLKSSRKRKTSTHLQFNFTEWSQLPKSCVNPHNKSIPGVPFQLDSNSAQLATSLIHELQNGRKIGKITIDTLVQTVTPVTAISSNHFNELMDNINQGLRVFRLPNMKVIVYDLGLYTHQVQTLKQDDFISYRFFNFSNYPNHVKNLYTYAFKPLIIQKVLAERGAVLWMDSSVRIKDNITIDLEQMVRKRSGILHYSWQTGHSIVAATHPQMLEYIPLPDPKNCQQQMPSVTGMILLHTDIVRDKIMTKAILCSLKDDCIAPKGSKLFCNFNFPKDRFGGCHRYDQSMMSILVNKAFNGQEELYVEDPGHQIADIKRSRK